MSATTIRIRPGEWGIKDMPHSEVCIHMQVAGQRMVFRLLPSSQASSRAGSVQLYGEIRETAGWTPRSTYPSGHSVSRFQPVPYSSPITLGEAGIFEDSEGYYYYQNDHGA